VSSKNLSVESVPENLDRIGKDVVVARASAVAIDINRRDFFSSRAFNSSEALLDARRFHTPNYRPISSLAKTDSHKDSIIYPLTRWKQADPRNSGERTRSFGYPDFNPSVIEVREPLLEPLGNYPEVTNYFPNSRITGRQSTLHGWILATEVTNFLESSFDVHFLLRVSQLQTELSAFSTGRWRERSSPGHALDAIVFLWLAPGKSASARTSASFTD
jgi:hypothetical protein